MAVALGAALVAVGGLAGAGLVTSPAERAARTAPPPRSLITAPVTSQVLNRSVSARAVIHPPAQYDIVPTAATADITRLYVSRLDVRTGDAVAAGTLLAEVSGQPIVVLRGPVPAYRDLKPGSTGPDVTGLQEALAALGHGYGPDRKGTFGPGTGRAVSAFYERLGYPVPTTGSATRQAVETAQKAVDAARQQVDALTAQKRAAAQPPPPAQPPTAPNPAPPPAPAPTPDPTQAQAPPAAAPTGAPAPTAPAGAELDRQLTAARKQSADAQAALTEARALHGPMVPAAHVVFLPTLPATVTAVNGSVGSAASGTLLSLTSGDLGVTGRLTPDQAAGVRPGMAVELLVEETGTTLRGTVGELGTPTSEPPSGRVVTLGGATGAGPAAGGAAGPGAGPGGPVPQPGGGPAHVPVTIVPAAPLPAALNGRNVRLTVLRDGSDRPVTAVPVAALSTDAAGLTSVTTVDAAGNRTTVPVTTGVSADGLVAVVPAPGAALAPGDQVVVGT
ncbi:peptidoglycan-binding protein [Kitasatospora sp. NPDC054939]